MCVGVDAVPDVSLAEHLSNRQPWDLDRTVGGLMVLQPHRGTERQGWHAATRMRYGGRTADPSARPP